MLHIGQDLRFVNPPERVDALDLDDYLAMDEDIDATLRMGETLRSIWPQHEVKVHFYAPYPGTPMWNDALEHGFVPPSNLDEWSKFDYYAVTTPWIDPAWQPVINSFNKLHCPYVHV